MSKSIFILITFLLLASWSVVATHSLTVTVESDTPSVDVDDEFNLNVYLNLPAGGVATDTLYEASLRFERESTNVEFVSLAFPNLVGSIFNPLIQNQPSAGNWVMEGDGGGTDSYSLSSSRALLGRIRVRATASGAITLELGTNTLVQSYGLPPTFVNHLYTPSLVMGSVTVGGDAVCNDANPSSCTTQATCTAADNYWSAGTCYNTCPAGTEDPNSDQVCTVVAAPVFTLTSTAFTSGGNIPFEHTLTFEDAATTCPGGSNVNPPLTISNAPAGTNSFVILMDDLDTVTATEPDPVVHWVVWNIPVTTTVIPQGWDVPADVVQGMSDLFSFEMMTEAGYAGPCPPAGESHRYSFHLYALSDASVDLITLADTSANGVVTVSEFEAARSAGDFTVLGDTTLAGWYPSAPGGGPVCPNDIPEVGETCSSCPSDVLCGAGESCVADICVAVPVCGDSAIEGAEQCEGTNLNENTCTTVPGGFTGGTLSCTAATCEFNTALCNGAQVTECTSDDCEIGQACSKETDECVPLDPAALFQQKISTLIQGECYPTRTHSSALYCEDEVPILGTMTTSDGEPDDFRRRVYIIAQTGIALREFFQGGMAVP